jgi:hypothetical protein
MRSAVDRNVVTRHIPALDHNLGIKPYNNKKNLRLISWLAVSVGPTALFGCKRVYFTKYFTPVEDRPRLCVCVSLRVCASVCE